MINKILREVFEDARDIAIGAALEKRSHAMFDHLPVDLGELAKQVFAALG
jgi:hypothetical protein